MSDLAMHEQIDRRKTHTLDGEQTWAQVGWLGQTGRVYNTHEDPSRTEPGGFAPLWLLIEDETPEPPEASR